MIRCFSYCCVALLVLVSWDSMENSSAAQGNATPAEAALPQAISTHWPTFRGPRGDGHVLGIELPVQLDKRVKWKTAIHGRGWSSPVIWGDQVWLTTATEDGKQMFGVCVSLKDGSVIHDLMIHENPEPAFSHPTNSYASPTPVIEEGRVYLHFGSYGTTCLNTKTGEQIWQRKDLECDHFRGPASSPIIFNDKLIVAFDGFDRQYVVALDKATGKTIWKDDRNIKYKTDNGDWKKAYSTAAVFEIEGQPLLISPSAQATIAYDPDNGKQIWKLYHDGMNTSVCPLLTRDKMVVLTNGMGRMDVVDPTGKGDVTETHVKWMTKKGVAKRPSPIIVDNRIYMFTDKGVASCTNASDGSLVWQERIGGSFAASPIFDGRHIFAFDEKGEIVVVKPGDEFELVAELSLGDGFKGSPAVVAGGLVLRSISDLYCVDLE